jgi:hypothetical protein
MLLPFVSILEDGIWSWMETEADYRVIVVVVIVSQPPTKKLIWIGEISEHFNFQEHQEKETEENKRADIIRSDGTHL